MRVYRRVVPPSPYGMVPPYGSPMSMPMYSHTVPAPLQQAAVLSGYYTTNTPIFQPPLPVTTTYTAAFVPPSAQPPEQHGPAVQAGQGLPNPNGHLRGGHGGVAGGPGRAGGVASAAAPPRPSTWARLTERGRAVLHLCDWQLAAKMVMLVVLLNPGDPIRLVSLAFFAFCAFLYQTGILGLFLGPAFTRGPQPAEDEAAGAGAGAQAPGGAGGPDPQPQAQQAAPEADAPQAGGVAPPPQAAPTAASSTPQAPVPPPRLPSPGLARNVMKMWWAMVATVRETGKGVIPREPGIVLDLYIVLCSFVFSLFPT